MPLATENVNKGQGYRSPGVKGCKGCKGVSHEWHFLKVAAVSCTSSVAWFWRSFAIVSAECNPLAFS